MDLLAVQGTLRSLLQHHSSKALILLLCFQVWLKSNPLQVYMEVTSRFKGLDLIDRVPGELWTEVHDIVQEVGIKTIPKEKKCKKAKWLSQKALL